MGFLTLGTATVLPLLASISTVIGGVLQITDYLSIDYNSYRQDWNKWGIVDDDSTCYYHYHAGRTKFSEIWEFSNGESHVEILSDRAGTNFSSNTNILNATITNYKTEH